MPKTRIYLEDGVYKGSLSGNLIREYNPKRHEIVSPDVDRARREAFRAANRGPGARGGVGPRPGIRVQAKGVYDRSKAHYAGIGDPQDGLADVNTARMLVKLNKHNPQFHRDFIELAERLNSHYFKYNPVSHSFEMYTHRQSYLGSYQLPFALRSKKVDGVVQHYPRATSAKSNKGGPTVRYISRGEGVMPDEDFARRPRVGRA